MERRAWHFRGRGTCPGQIVSLFVSCCSPGACQLLPPFSFIEFVVCCVWGGMDAEALRAKLDVIPAFVRPGGCRWSWTEDTQNCWAPGTVPSDALTSEQS